MIHSRFALAMGAACLLSFGCSAPSEHAQAVPEPSPAAPAGLPSSGAVAVSSPAPGRAEQRIRAPFYLDLVAPDDVAKGEEAKVLVRIDVQGGALAPLDLRLELPEGFTLLSGEARERIEEVKPGEILRHLVVRVDDPAAALVVTASMEGDGFGATARREHRFQRVPEEKRERPRPGGSPVRLR